jgi:iron complex outermembrane receptor protein/vitamin B12 transporter
VVGPVRLMGSYTFLDADVSESFSGGVLAPAVNPAFPDIQIGQFAPLVGARPFRRPTHSGSLMVAYLRGPADVAVSTYFSGTRDGSTFLSDGFFGSSLLLPNKDLEAAFQKVDLSAGYRMHRRLKAFVSIENVLNRDYQASFGFPSLPIATRAGVTVNVGGS